VKRKECGEVAAARRSRFENKKRGRGRQRGEVGSKMRKTGQGGGGGGGGRGPISSSRSWYSAPPSPFPSVASDKMNSASMPFSVIAFSYLW
jgi:hypothetical protein